MEETLSGAGAAAVHESGSDALGGAADLFDRHRRLASTDPNGARLALNESLALYRECHASDPSSLSCRRALIAALMALARAEDVSGDTPAAVPLYREAHVLLLSLPAGSEDPSTLSDRCDCVDALLTLEGSTVDDHGSEPLLAEMLEVTGRLIEAEPENARWHQKRIAALLQGCALATHAHDAARRGELAAEAVESAHAATDLEPGDDASKAWLAEALEESGEAEAELGRAIRGSGRVRAAIELWRELARSARPPPGARDRLREAMMKLGELEFGMGSFGAAARWFGEALVLAEAEWPDALLGRDETVAAIHLSMGRAFLADGDAEAAGRHAEQALFLSHATARERPCSETLLQLAAAHQLDAVIHLRSKRISLARRAWDRAISATRQSAAAAPDVGGAAARLGQEWRSRAAFEAAAGYGATAQSMLGEAAEAYRKAIVLDPGAEEWRWALVEVLSSLERLATRWNNHDIAGQAALDARAAASAAVATTSGAKTGGVVGRFVARSPEPGEAGDDSGKDGSAATWALGALRPAKRGDPSDAPSARTTLSHQNWLEQHDYRVAELREEAEKARSLDRARRDVEVRRSHEMTRRAEEDRQAGVSPRVLAARTEWRTQEDARYAAELARIEQDSAKHQARVAESELAWTNRLSEWGAADDLERDRADVAAGRRLRSRLPTC